MSISLLATKLYFPPVRPSLVPRPHLVERLQAGLKGPLTLISAPARCGKTTLMSEWRASVGSAFPVAWFSIDSGDNNPFRFWGYVTAALATLDRGLTISAATLLQSPQFPPAEEFITALINSVSSIPKDFVLLLDDYHAITTPEIHKYLAFLVDHLPPKMHLVLLTRADPFLPLARLRARGQLMELRAGDLRFTAEEAAQFLNAVMGLDLTPEKIGALEQRTEGQGLHLRAQPGLDNAPQFLGYDAEVYQITGGPQQADGYTWWYLTAPYDQARSGWAVQDYLTVIPSP